MSERKGERRIQGLFDPDAEDRDYGSLLAFVELSRFRDKKGRVNPSKTPTLSLHKEKKKHDRKRKRKHS